MTDLRTAAQQALEALERIDQADNDCDFLNPSQCYQLDEAMTALRAALAEPQSTHSADCYKWHHECAIARIEETEELREALKAELERTLTDEDISVLWHQSGEQPFKFARMLLK